MNPDWLYVSFVASTFVAILLALILIGSWVDEWFERREQHDIREIRNEANRVVRHGDQHPWMIR